jgi:uncharacterized protein
MTAMPSTLQSTLQSTFTTDGQVHVTTLQQTPVTPWRNGGGSTQELLAWPDATNWLCRISVAHIHVDGPFSAYPGVQRWFTVLQGQGVELQLAGQAITQTAQSEALCFDGAAAPGCRLLGGPTLDLNLMAQRQAGSAVLQRAHAGVLWQSTATLRAVFTLDAAVLQLPGGRVLALPAGALAHSSSSAGPIWQLGSPTTNQQPPPRAWWMSFAASSGQTVAVVV